MDEVRKQVRCVMKISRKLEVLAGATVCRAYQVAVELGEDDVALPQLAEDPGLQEARQAPVEGRCEGGGVREREADGTRCIFKAVVKQVPAAPWTRGRPGGAAEVCERAQSGKAGVKQA